MSKDYMETAKEKEEAAFQAIVDLAENFEQAPETIAEYLAFSSRFYSYSPRNVMLIMEQNPGATFVDSYVGWKKREAQVQKGQHGMSILVPVNITYLHVEDKWIQLSHATREQKQMAQKGEIETRSKRFFKTGTVFDIAQTDFPKEQYPRLFYMGYASEDHEKICQGLMDFSNEQLGCEVHIADLSSIALRGRYIHSDPPVIELNRKLEATQKLSTLSHELGHALVHSGAGDKNITTAQKEFEADAFSIMLDSSYGMELTESRKHHLAAHTSDFRKHVMTNNTGSEEEKVNIWKETLYRSFDRVYHIYRENIPKIEKYVERFLDRQEQVVPEEDVEEEMEERVPKM